MNNRDNWPTEKEKVEYNSSYSDPNERSTSDKIKKGLTVAGEVVVAASTVAAGYVTGNAILNNDSKDQNEQKPKDGAVVEPHNDTKDQTEKNPEAGAVVERHVENGAGFSTENIDYEAIEGDSYDKIAEMQLTTANIKATPELIRLVSDYLMNINGGKGSLLGVEQKVRVPKSWARFKEIQRTIPALPEATNIIFSDETDEMDLSGLVCVVASSRIDAAVITEGETIEQLAQTIPGYSEFADNFPNFKRLVFEMIIEDNLGKFKQGPDGITVARNGMAVIRNMTFVNPGFNKFGSDIES